MQIPWVNEQERDKKVKEKSVDFYSAASGEEKRS